MSNNQHPKKKMLWSIIKLLSFFIFWVLLFKLIALDGFAPGSAKAFAGITIFLGFFYHLKLLSKIDFRPGHLFTFYFFYALTLRAAFGMTNYNSDARCALIITITINAFFILKEVVSESKNLHLENKI